LSSIKSRLRSAPVLGASWARFRQWQLHREYEQRREHYAARARESALQYEEKATIAAIRTRIRERGYTPAPRDVSGVHTFALIPQFSWHRHLLPDLRELGPVTLFDYVAEGYSPDIFYGPGRWSPERMQLRKEMVQKVIPRFRQAHRAMSVDWVLCYGGGQDISASAIRQIVDEYGIPAVNMTFDDKQGWAGAHCGERHTGARDLTSEFDAFFTSARVACEWHAIEGGRAIYLPEGFNNSHFHPRLVTKDIDVSFVGVSYGFRQGVIRFLHRHGVQVQAFGTGWPNGFTNDPVEIFNRSVINLGMGGIGYSERLTNVKGRDFEIPGTGGGVYLTSFNPDLAQHFVVGEEILCYRNRDEMLELIRHYLQHRDESERIAQRGRARAMREHRWIHRYERMAEIVGVLNPAGSR
jgi:hypothetical protein